PPTSLPFSLSALRPPPNSTPFPYTTLFRSQQPAHLAALHQRGDAQVLTGSDGIALQLRHEVGDIGSAGRLRMRAARHDAGGQERSEEHTSELQSRGHLVCRLLLEKKKEEDS